jgi:hypothetical protein
MQACLLNIAGCAIAITVDDSERQADVLAAVAASTSEIASIIVQRLRLQTPVEEWDLVDEPSVRPSAKPPPPLPPAGSRAVAGNSVPPPPPGPAPETTDVPPPPPPRSLAKTRAAQRPLTAAEFWGGAPRDALPSRPIAGVPLTPAAAAGAPGRELDMQMRFAKATEYGAAAGALLAGVVDQRWPSPLAATTPPLRNRVWVVLTVAPGIYERWDAVVASGGNVPGTGVQGFASLLEARAYAVAAGHPELARR